MAGVLQRYGPLQASDEKRKERAIDGGRREWGEEGRGVDRKPGEINKGIKKAKEDTSYDSLCESFDSKQRRRSRSDDDGRRGKRRRRRSDFEDESHRGSSRDDDVRAHRHHHHHHHYDRDSDHRSMGRESLDDKGWESTEIMDPKVREAAGVSSSVESTTAAKGKREKDETEQKQEQQATRGA
eukprot:CAMPEP_0175049282 /NCGR_PEP_ID=MMETSP0052_2-20121109/6649_1 /TAXON_ID=51329 ORGANISM="Polytomella parva, Strain SAG 63-3" /NCGR_SAMPLE_ID=MMETSP0052_2 /ASSEMBLY_ACC=CAM_ASM_000194 /LENGTH=182 /DNA_ID=CAMNT_0016313421 /DNA_START=330 /DNA_END=880 /DNA_ORIENTATION=+